MSRKRPMKATTFIEQLPPSAGALVEIDLTDKNNVPGVSWNPKKRKWRSYLHIGKKQVYHGYFDTKEEAAFERRQAEQRYHRIDLSAPEPEREGRYRTFDRKIKAPRYRILDRNLEHLSEEASLVINIKGKVIRDGLSDYHKGVESNKKQLGRAIGKMLTIVDLLVMDGAVLTNDIAEGMKAKAENLKTMY